VQYEIHELIEVLRQFPQNAKVQIEHCRQDEKGLLKWDLFEFVSIEGNEDDDPRKNENVIIWIKPLSSKEITHGTQEQT